MHALDGPSRALPLISLRKQRYRNPPLAVQMKRAMLVWRENGQPQRTPEIKLFYSEITGQPMPRALPRQPVAPGQLPRTCRQAWLMNPVEVAGLAPHLGVIAADDEDRLQGVITAMGAHRDPVYEL